MFSKMVSMAKSPEEMKGDYPAPMSTSEGKISGPKYPYGLCISLDDETLEKLGLDGELPSAGETVQFSAIAKVTSSSDNEMLQDDGSTKRCCRVELQITDMGVPDPDPKPRQWYGKDMVEDNDNDDE
jgi:hypothetical protein